MGNQTVILHLSDIHINSTKANPILNRSRGIAQSLRLVTAETLEKCLILVTGDIAFSGSREEYSLAEKFFNDIKNIIISEKIAKEVLFFAVPGNHDCSHPKTNISRTNNISTLLREKTIDDSVIENCISVQQNFFDFLERMTGQTYPITEKLTTSISIGIEDKTIQIIGFNTAWLSQKNENQSKLYMPVESLKPALTSANLTITALHHPDNWLEAINAREFTTFIEGYSNLIITGHEHMSEHYEKIINNSSIEYIKSGVLQDSSNYNESGYNIIEIDFASNRKRNLHLIWKGGRYIAASNYETWKEIGYTRVQRDGIFALQNSFKTFLYDPGITFSHPRKQKVYLEDIFVYPDLTLLSKDTDEFEVVESEPSRNDIKLSKDSRKHNRNKLLGKDVAKIFLEKDYIAIYGQERSGKTSLAKQLFISGLNSGYLPIYFEWNSLEGVSSQNFVDVVQKRFLQIYDRSDVNFCTDESISKKIAIVDDFQKLNPEMKKRIVSFLKSHFSKIIVLLNDEVFYSEIEGFKTEFDLLKSFERFKIKPFGFSLRRRLIEKWFALGLEQQMTSIDFETKVRKCEKIVDTIISKKLAAQNPLSVLIIIQNYESGSPSDIESGTFGHLYEILIKFDLAKFPEKSPNYVTRKTFLSEMAYYIYNKNLNVLRESDFTDLVSGFQSKYDSEITGAAFLDTLSSLSVITTANSYISFKYKHVYHYFLALYLSSNTDDFAVKETIKNIAENIYLEENASIILFLGHLSKSKFFIDQLLDVARSIFRDQETADFSTNISQLRQTMDEVPEFVIKRNQHKDNREAQLIAKDESAESAGELSPLDDPEFSEIFKQMTSALRTIDVMGQLLRNFSGSLSGTDKERLAIECYSLGMRFLTFTFNLVQKSVPEIINQVINTLMEEGEINAKDQLNSQERNLIAKEVSRMMFAVTELTAFGTIKRLSYAIYAEDLSITHKKLAEKIDTVASRLLSVSLKMDSLQRFPIDEVEDLNEELKSNFFATTILRRLTWSHFYVFPSNRETLQRVCNKLKIKLEGFDLAELAENLSNKALPKA